MRNTNEKLEQNNFKERKSRRYPKDETWRRLTIEVARNRKAAVEEKEERVWVI